MVETNQGSAHRVFHCLQFSDKFPSSAEKQLPSLGIFIRSFTAFCEADLLLPKRLRLLVSQLDCGRSRPPAGLARPLRIPLRRKRIKGLHEELDWNIWGVSAAAMVRSFTAWSSNTDWAVSFPLLVGLFNFFLKEKMV